ncbi:MAG: isoprenylcysteine carboxylmethyltransferase family protein [Devosia sp.]
MRQLDWPPLWTLAHMAAASLLGWIWAPLGPEAAIIGWALIGASVGLAIWAALVMHRAKTTVIPGRPPAALVETGPFKKTRNPIYLADLGILAGWCWVMEQPLGILLLFPLQWVLQNRFVLPEEAALRAAFGEAFDAYCARVPRWV